MGLIGNLFGNKNEREIKRLHPLVDKINGLGDVMKAKSDANLQAMTGEFRQKLDNGASLDDILPDAFAVVREAGWRTLKMRHYDVQLVGGMVLHSGRIAEMRTGEGKTLVATLPAYLNGLSGKGVHVVTVNDYLARRDAEWMGTIYRWLGLDVGVVLHGLTDYERQRNYRCDITYGQNNEFGFDYLRDNMKESPDRMVQRELNYAIVDEVDSILIDEARTPLIISGAAAQSASLYKEVDRVIPRLKREIDYTVDEKAHSTMLTDLGVERIQKLLNIDNLYDPQNITFNHRVNQALRAHTLYKRDVNYLIEDSKVLIIDEHTGRKMPGRRWSDGLHQAIEAKEGVEIEEETQTMATITFQNYFRMYDKLSGMTGTADTEATEFYEIYKLECVVIPTNKPILRDDQKDLIYKTEEGKFRAIIQDIVESNEKGQPVLVGTVSVEKSELLAKLLKQRKIPYQVLNAKQHQKEAGVVAQAGRKGAITISTNMAGRGTDIILGGNPEVLAEEALKAELSKNKDLNEEKRREELLAKFTEQCATEKEEVLASGGLRIIGTERHESRRIDNQLRGRAGRQGDPGSSLFYLSLDDDLMRIFGGERMRIWMDRLGMEEDVPLEAKMVNRAIENAQKKVEGRNFDMRKNVIEYDDVMNQQRKTIYSLRKQVLEGKYLPELSEDEIKKGVIAKPPETSGDWTLESLKADVHQEVGQIIDDVLDAIAQRDEKVASGEIELSEDDLPAWRILRHELWRVTGCLCDVQSRVEKLSRSELKDSITQEVSASLIQQRERLLDLSDSLIGYHVDTHCPEGTGPDDWNLEKLQESLSDQFNVKVILPDRPSSTEQIAEEVWSQVERRVEARQEELTRPWLMYFFRHFYLEEIDGQWIEHLTTMTQLREGIGLRGYAQKDPKKEYKREGFELFRTMMDRIQLNVGDKLFKVMFKQENKEIPTLQQRQRDMQESHGGTSAYGDAADGSKKAGEKQQTIRRDRPKVGRNDPCPCGSGKKYKKCHGKAGNEMTV